MDLMESLINLGLNEKEARVYLALLPLEKATAYTVATRSGLKKPTAYVVLDNLVSKGFALKIPQKDKHYFLAKSPKECMSIAREKLYSAEEFLPELMAMRKTTEEKANISYFEGIDGIREMYKNVLGVMKNKPEENKNLVAFYAHTKDTPANFRKYLEEMVEKFREEKIQRRYITTKHPTVKKYFDKKLIQGLHVEAQALPEEIYSSNISIEVYDNFTQIISHRYIQGILIENPDIAKVMKQIFNLVWNKTKK